MNPTTVDARPGTPFIDVVREFEATPAQVFRASTDPALVARWLGPREHFEVGELLPPSLFRLYRANATEHSVLIRGGDPKCGRGADSRLTLSDV